MENEKPVFTFTRMQYPICLQTGVIISGEKKNPRGTSHAVYICMTGLPYVVYSPCSRNITICKYGVIFLTTMNREIQNTHVAFKFERNSSFRKWKSSLAIILYFAEGMLVHIYDTKFQIILMIWSISRDSPSDIFLMSSWNSFIFRKNCQHSIKLKFYRSFLPFITDRSRFSTFLRRQIPNFDLKSIFQQNFWRIFKSIFSYFLTNF